LTTLLVLLGIAAAVALGYALGRSGGRRSASRSVATLDAASEPAETSPQSPPATPPGASPNHTLDAELHRLVRSHEADAARLRCEVRNRDAALQQLGEFAQERHGLFGELARSRADTARYRQLVIDIENNAPPNLFGPAAPDDLKLIVGVGPVLERMLHQLGVTRYRQIARWTERDIDDIDAHLPEFPGRIRRDTWVVQARALHQSKYGERI
jgi:predicted flap endonuclease-1-like 5' DNA nuclease